MFHFTSNEYFDSTCQLRIRVHYVTCDIQTLSYYTTVCFENNHATLGGAIYVSDVNPLIYCSPKYVAKEESFFQLPGQNPDLRIDVKLVFKNNSADAAESVLYGGAVDNCKLNDQKSSNSGEVFDKILHIEDDNDS